MRSYRFLKMAVMASQILFRLVCLMTALVWYISINGWVITTSGFRKQMADILEVFFLFAIWTRTSLFNATKFHAIVIISGIEYGWRWSLSWICTTVLLGHPRSRVDGPKKHLRGVFVVNLHSRFVVCSFSHSTDTEGPKVLKVGHVTFSRPSLT